MTSIQIQNVSTNCNAQVTKDIQRMAAKWGGNVLIIAFLFLMAKKTKFDPETSLWGLLARVQDNCSSDSPVMKTQL